MNICLEHLFFRKSCTNKPIKGLGPVLLVAAVLVLSACTQPQPLGGEQVPPTELPGTVPEEAIELTKYFGSRPPMATLIVGEQQQEAAIGTSTWVVEQKGEEKTIIHSDAFGLVTPAEPLIVSSPITATLVLPIPLPPSDLWYRVIPAADASLQSTGEPAALTWLPGTSQPRIFLPSDTRHEIPFSLDPGQYLIEVYVEWPDLGDADYGFLVEMQGSLPVGSTYIDPSGQFRLSLPPGWLPGLEEGTFSGGGEILQISYLPEMAYMNSVTRVCERLANTPQGPARQIILFALAEADACLLVPYPEMSTNQARLVVENPAGRLEQRYFSLESDEGSLREIAASLQLLNPPGQREAFPYPSGPMRPQDEAFWSQPTSLPVGLTVEEYPIVEASIDSPDHFEFRERIPSEVFEKRAAWREVRLDRMLDRNNALLEPFGYSLKARSGSDVNLFELYHGEDLIQEDVSYFWPVSTNPSGSDFALVLEVWNEGYRLARLEGLSDWDMSASLFIPPVFYGEDLLSIRWDGQRSQVQLWQGEHEVYEFASLFMVDMPVKGLSTWQGDWILEVDGFVIQDGENLNERLGYEDIFGWQLLNGNPFYYFRKGPWVGISYNGQVLPQIYNEIVHYRCCEPAMFNNGGNQDMVWFYGLRDGTWYYVEIGSYD
jgi:hypothetical protein